jgi:hypothetical protein
MSSSEQYGGSRAGPALNPLKGSSVEIGGRNWSEELFGNSWLKTLSRLSSPQSERHTCRRGSQLQDSGIEDDTVIRVWLAFRSTWRVSEPHSSRTWYSFQQVFCADIFNTAVFLPFQKKLDKARSMELIDRLLKYDGVLGEWFPPHRSRCSPLS